MRQLNPADVERLAHSMVATIDQVSSSRWDAAVTRAAGLKGDVRPEKMKSLTDSFARELGAFGDRRSGSRDTGDWDGHHPDGGDCGNGLVHGAGG